jgi:hypothetical protein
MNSKSEDAIFSCEIKYGHLDFTKESKGKLDNLDSWVVETDHYQPFNPFLIPKKYVEEVFNKISLKKKPKEEENKFNGIQ